MTNSRISVDSRRLIALSAAGMSQRGIARRLGLKPTFVRQKLNELLRTSPEEMLDNPPQINDSVSEPHNGHFQISDIAPPGYDEANLRRCHGCGGLVYLWPCLICSMAGKVDSQPPRDTGA